MIREKGSRPAWVLEFGGVRVGLTTYENMRHESIPRGIFYGLAIQREIKLKSFEFGGKRSG